MKQNILIFIGFMMLSFSSTAQLEISQHGLSASVGGILFKGNRGIHLGSRSDLDLKANNIGFLRASDLSIYGGAVDEREYSYMCDFNTICTGINYIPYNLIRSSSNLMLNASVPYQPDIRDIYLNKSSGGGVFFCPKGGCQTNFGVELQGQALNVQSSILLQLNTPNGDSTFWEISPPLGHGSFSTPLNLNFIHDYVDNNNFSNFTVGRFSASDGEYEGFGSPFTSTEVSLIRNGIDVLMQLNPVTYYMKHTNSDDHSCAKDAGFVAQEVEEILPDAVQHFQGEEDYYLLSYKHINVYATAALQEQQQLLEAKEQQLVHLEKELKELKALAQQILKETN